MEIYIYIYIYSFHFVCKFTFFSLSPIFNPSNTKKNEGNESVLIKKNYWNSLNPPIFFLNIYTPIFVK